MSDFASLLDRVREGAEIVIEHDARPVAVMRPAEPYVRLLSESLRLAREPANSYKQGSWGCGSSTRPSKNRENLRTKNIPDPLVIKFSGIAKPQIGSFL